MKKQIKAESDTKNDTNSDDGIHILRTATCPNLAGKAKLTYQIGRSSDGTLRIRIVGNSGSGSFSDEWCQLASMWEELAKNSPNEGPVTSGDIARLWVGSSTNSAGFQFAVLKAEGFVVASRQKRRCYDRVDAAAYEAKCRSLLDGKVAKEARAKKTGGKPADDGRPRRAARAPRKRKSS